jgi:hypothetical protein
MLTAAAGAKLPARLLMCRDLVCTLMTSPGAAGSTGQNVYLDNAFPLTPMAGRHLVEVKLGASYVCGCIARQVAESSSLEGMLHHLVDSTQVSNACCM